MPYGFVALPRDAELLAIAQRISLQAVSGALGCLQSLIMNSWNLKLRLVFTLTEIVGIYISRRFCDCLVLGN